MKTKIELLINNEIILMDPIRGVGGREGGGGIPRRKPPWFLLKEPQNFDVIIQFRQ